MRFIPYVYFLRVPLVFAILLALLPVLGLVVKTPVQSVIRGMFDLRPWGAFFVCFATLLFGGALSVQTCLILLYGRMRFFAAKISEDHLKPAFRIAGLEVPRASVRLLIFYAVCCGAMLIGVVSGAEWKGWQGRTGAALAALVIFAALVYGLAIVWKRAGSHLTEWIADRLRWSPWGFLKLKKTEEADRIAIAEVHREWPFQDPAQLLPGHGFALLLLGASAAFYAMFALGQWKLLDAVEQNQTDRSWLILPVLASIVVLFGLLLWGLGGLAYLLDRYRVPVFVPLVMVFTFTAENTNSDHYFDIQPLVDQTPFSVTDAVKAEGTAIIITASGGGIKAAAWTARVLSGLVSGMPKEFAPSIRVISSVSGGSVGALYFVHSYKDGTISAEDAKKVVEAAEASSLDEVGWGFVYPDVWRSVMPMFLSSRIDRGWALETTFLREMRKLGGGEPPTLGAWRTDARNHKRPAVIFNTTTVESGERFLFPTVDLERVTGRRSFHDLEDHEKLDLRANTAARLSATFPYVTPVSRANCCGPLNQRFHFADGGYHDNFGIASASELLRQAIPVGPRPLVKRILMIQIMLDGGGDGTAQGSRGWFFQTFAPVATLLNMRDSAQFTRNQAEVGLLTERLCFQGVTTRVVQFVYPKRVKHRTAVCGVATEPPVSWHMTESDKCDVEESWGEFVTRRTELDAIREFLISKELLCKRPGPGF